MAPAVTKSADHDHGNGPTLCQILKCVGGLVLVVAVAAIAAHLIFGIGGKGSESGRTALNFPKGGPTEFLYLDSGRVAAFLAQFDGGSFSNEKETHKLTDTLEGNLSVSGIKAGASRSEEDFIEREVTPTTASSFFALYTAMKKQHEVRRVPLSHFESAVHSLPEGQFVSFTTPALLSPIYLDAYLASRRPHGLREIFPPNGRHGAPPQVTVERRAAWKFKSEVGKDPRIVFSLHTGHRESHEKQFVYLLPMSAELLTEEQSLLSHGGGKFTVVGKLVRSFPEEGDRQKRAYIDSAALQTWEAPLRSAPGELICRTEPRCVTYLREHRLRRKERLKPIRAARRRELRALTEQTEIEKRGAVILPIAIYK
jgi:hypothetical protein